MQKIKLINLVAVLLGLFLFGACEYTSIQTDVPPPPGDSTSFSLQIQPVFDKSCVTNCHDGQQIPDLREDKSYKSLMDNNQVVKFNSGASKLYQKMLPGASMNKWSNTNDIALIKYWIDEGAKNN